MENSECAERPGERHSQSSLFVLLLRGSLAAAFLFFSLSSIGLKWAKVRMNPLKFTWSSLKTWISRWDQQNQCTGHQAVRRSRRNQIGFKTKTVQLHPSSIKTTVNNTQKRETNTRSDHLQMPDQLIPSALRWPHRENDSGLWCFETQTCWVRNLHNSRDTSGRAHPSGKKALMILSPRGLIANSGILWKSSRLQTDRWKKRFSG